MVALLTLPDYSQWVRVIMAATAVIVLGRTLFRLQHPSNPVSWVAGGVLAIASLRLHLPHMTWKEFVILLVALLLLAATTAVMVRYLSRVGRYSWWVSFPFTIWLFSLGLFGLALLLIQWGLAY